MIDAFTIIAISIFSTLLSEGISWIMIYRTEEYKKLKKSIDNLTSKVDKKKSEKGDSTDSKVTAKKISSLDEQLKSRQRDMSFAKMKSTVFVGVVMLSVFGMLNNLFEGQAVAKLPFEPFPLLSSMSHRGLMGSDLTDCSFMFIYILCQFSIRAHITKYLGFTPASTGPSMFQPPSQ